MPRYRLKRGQSVSKLDELPEEVARELMSFLIDVDGDLRVNDVSGFLTFVAHHSENYASLLELIKVDEEAVIAHFEETGEVPPGLKLVGKTTEAHSNVTHLQILRGPIPPRE